MIKISDIKNIENYEEIKGLKIKTYAPIIEKIAVIDAITDSLISEDDLNWNPIKEEVLTTLATVTLFTNIQIDGDTYEAYDIVMKSKLWNSLNVIEDVNNFKLLVEKKLNSIIERNSINNIISQKADDALVILNKSVEHINQMIDRADLEVISKHISDSISPITNKLKDMSTTDIVRIIKGLK